MSKLFLVVALCAFLSMGQQAVYADDHRPRQRSTNKHYQQRSTPRRSHSEPRMRAVPSPYQRRDTYKHSHKIKKPHPVYPQRHDNRQWRDYYRPGYQLRYLPHGFNRLFVGGLEYFFFDGFFYRPHRNEYRVVDAPIGAIVLSLPRLHFNFVWNGLDYFVSGNTYYRPHPQGYVVVPNPGYRGDWR